MKVYSVDVQMVGTAYIKANSEEEALVAARAFFKFPEGTETIPDQPDCLEDGSFCDLRLDHPDLPDISLSPALTFHGIDERTMEMAEDLEESDDEDEEANVD
jgi:hypothetical protein